MSTDYHLHCDECNQTSDAIASSGPLLVGGSRWVINHLFRDRESVDKLNHFLFEHKGHSMRFLSEQDVYDMQNVED